MFCGRLGRPSHRWQIVWSGLWWDCMVPRVCMWFSSTHQISDWQTACQVAPFRKLRKEKSEQGKGKITDFIKYDIRQMHTAFTGTIPFSREEEDVLVSLASSVTHIVESY